MSQVRLILAFCLCPPLVVIGLHLGIGYFRSRTLIFRVVGANIEMQKMCQRLFIFFDLLKFDFQLSVSVLFLPFTFLPFRIRLLSTLFFFVLFLLCNCCFHFFFNVFFASFILSSVFYLCLFICFFQWHFIFYFLHCFSSRSVCFLAYFIYSFFTS